MKNLFLTTSLLLAILLSACNTKEEKFSVFLAGDSTMQTYNPEKRLMRGWGQYFQENFDTTKIEIINHAKAGRSTKSFKDEGRWEKLMENVQANDYVIIQFGHNDGSVNKPERYATPDDYKENLKGFINDVREKGATPILATSIVMRRFLENGEFKDGHGLYPVKMRELAEEENVLLIDVHQKSMELVISLGDEGSKSLFMNVEPGETDEYPEGRVDNTHTREKGARAVVDIVVEELKNRPKEFGKLSKALLKN